MAVIAEIAGIAVNEFVEFRGFWQFRQLWQCSAAGIPLVDRIHRQRHGHDGAPLGRTRDRDLAVMAFDDPLCRRKPEPRAAVLRREERLEDAIADLRRDAGPA